VLAVRLARLSQNRQGWQMGKPVRVRQFVRWYEPYSRLIQALGHSLDDSRLLRRLADDPQDRRTLAGVLEAYHQERVDGQLVDGQACRRMHELLDDLVGAVLPQACRLAGRDAGAVPGSPSAVPALIADLTQEQRDELADQLLLNGHRAFLKPRYVTVEEFQQLLRQFAGDQSIARQRLIEYLRKEFRRRGIDMSCDTIEERFRSKPVVRTMPYCVKQIFRKLGDEFRTGLVPIEKLVGDEDPDVWLERARLKLLFRSHSVMHKAIAETTGVSYESIHKALSGKRKAKRIQAQVRDCLITWLQKAEGSEELAVADEYRGVPVEQMCALLPALQRAFRTKEAVYRAISEKTGVRPGSIRRYFQNDGLLKFAPLSVYQIAKTLAAAAPDASHRERIQQRVVREEPEGIWRTAMQAKKAWDKWRQRRDNSRLEREFKELRRALIIQLQERRRSHSVFAVAASP